MYDIVAIGELLIDFTYLSADPEGYPTLAAHPGGGPANFLAAAAKAGGRTALITKVGRDAFGGRLVKTLEQLGIETRGVVVTDEAFTTLAFVTLDDQGDREFSFARKPGADTLLRADEVDLSLIGDARALHFSSLSLTGEPSRSATRSAIEYAKLRGKLVSFDPNLRELLWSSPAAAKEQIFWGLSQADVVKISDSEVEFLFECSPAEGARCILDRFGAQLVFVTCGADGCWFQNGKAQGYVPNPTGLTAVDTTGAGDIFGGTALWEILKNGTPSQALDEAHLRQIAGRACAVAGLSTTRPGGISSIPSPAEIPF